MKGGLACTLIQTKADMETATRQLQRIARPLPGLALVAGLAGIALLAAQLPSLGRHGLSALTLAILGGVVLGNLGPSSRWSWAEAGIAFAKGPLLRIGIVLYGFRLGLQDLATVGPRGILLAALVVPTVFGLALWLGTRLFGLDRETAMLIGAGSAICGAAAVLATEPVMRAPSHKVSVAVATVVVFGTTAMVVYPLLYPLLGLDPRHFGLFAGATIHEVAQVVVAGRAVGEAAAAPAVIEKLIRVMMLAPFLLVLSWRMRGANAEGGTGLRLQVPWFALGFIAVTLLDSTPLVDSGLRATAQQIDTVLLAMAMAALGLHTRASALRQAGLRPLALAATLAVVLFCGGYGLTRLIVGAA